MTTSISKDAAQRILRLSDVAQECLGMLMPIVGFDSVPLVSLQTAVEPLVHLVPSIQSFAYSAKERCEKPPADGLTIDESASIMLYSMGWEPLDKCFYVVLNATLRLEDRKKLVPWFHYLKLFLTALSRLPSQNRTVFRGVKLDLHDKYVKDSTITWWGFSSCTASIEVLQSELFLGKTGARTMFTIECDSGKDISKHSYYPSEDEILLLAATQFKVIGYLDNGNNHYTVQLKEIKPPFPLLLPVKRVSISTVATTSISGNATPKETTYSSISPLSIKPPPLQECIPNIPPNAKWAHNGVTVAGGHGEGSAINQLNRPFGLFIQDNKTVLIAEYSNHRIIQWKRSDKEGKVIAGGHGKGNQLDQLNEPTDVLVDKKTDSLIISDWLNQRVVRWSRQSGANQGEILIDNIASWGLAMDDQGHLYVSDARKDEVRRYQVGEKKGTIVAGGHGKGARLNQLNFLTYIFVDGQQTVYVSDHNNHRVMKWNKGATEGIVVAGGQGIGSALTQLHFPYGLFVDTLGTLYVADTGNDRVMRWPKGAIQGTVIVGGNGRGDEANQFRCPRALSFDCYGNLYVVDNENNRVQLFSIQ